MRKDRGRHIYLIGFSGSGKSTVGRGLAARLGRKFVDVDDLIERQSGLTIAEIFAQSGERWFRTLESDAIREIAGRRGALVVALGGGAFERVANRRVIGQTGLSVFLQCGAAELYRRLAGRDDRPLLRPRAGERLSPSQAMRRRIEELLAKRRSRYLTADIRVVTTNRTVAGVVSEIRKLVGEWR